MDKDELMRLRQFYHSLLGQQMIFDSIANVNVEEMNILQLEDELLQLNKEFPSLIPIFDKEKYFAFFSVDGNRVYRLLGIRSYIAIAIGHLKIAIEKPTETPVTEKRQFSFIKDLSLRTIIERDYLEIQRAYIAQCWKSIIILCGGTIEAILTDLLKSNESSTKIAKSAPKEPNITKWDLSQLIEIAVELKLISSSVEKLSHSLREYRNLIHPGNELRNKLRFDAEEAKIAIEVLNIVHRDLSK